LDNGDYLVNWHTGQFNLVAAQIYRIRVTVSGQLLGFADVDPVNNGSQFKSVDTGQYIPLLGDRTLPVKFRIEQGAISGWTSITAGQTFTCGLASSGLAWGSNAFGALGIGSTTSFSTAPVPVAGGLIFTALSAGSSTACGLTASGAAYCWGADDSFQIGSPTVPDVCVASVPCSRAPLPVAGGLSFSSISVGHSAVCALTPAGAAYCWGDNTKGELGVNSSTGPDLCGAQPCSRVPVAVSGGLTFASIAAGGADVCGITPAGAAYCWGDAQFDQLGKGISASAQLFPTPVSGGLTFARIALGEVSATGVTTGGTAYSWGTNLFGALGTTATTETCTSPAFGTNGCSDVPIPVGGGLTFLNGAGSVSSELQTVCGLSASGAAYCRRRGGEGELGDVVAADSRVPVAVSGGLLFSVVTSGELHSCGITTSGTAYCWGSNIAGESGNSGPGSSSPVAVPNPV
jgi:alpha-tubulin suppressor-like RCC1 family protein